MEEIERKDEQWEENNVRRLRYLGEDEEAARTIVLIVPRHHRSGASRLALGILVALMTGVLGWIGVRGYRGRKEDQRKRELLRKKREREEF